MSSRETSEAKVPKAVLQALAHNDKVSLKRQIALYIETQMLALAPTVLGCKVELIDTGTPLSTTIRVKDRYFTIKVQEHR